MEDLEDVAQRLTTRVDAAASKEVAELVPGGFGAAVAAVLRGGEQGVELLLIERARHPGDPWSGQLAFPGGRRELDDRDDRETAERETREELALDLSVADWLTRLSSVSGRRGTGRRLEVTAHVYGLAEATVELQPNEEVADAFWVPLRHIVNAENAVRYRYPRMPWQKFDAIRMPGRQERVLWGLTLRFVEDLLGRLGAQLPRVGG